MKKKTMSLIAGVLSAAMLAGCGSAAASQDTAASKPAAAENAGQDAAQAETAAESGSGNFNEFGWEVPEETLVINILDAGGNYAPTEAQKAGEQNVIAYFKEKFNVEFNIQHISGDGTEAVNLALASGDYPDVIRELPITEMEKFVKMNKAVELTPYMNTVGADIKKSMGEHYPLFLDGESKLWYVPTTMGSIDELPDFCAHIRYDEWQAIGSPDIKTPDDYYNALNAILEKFPTTPNGESRYAMSLYDSSDPAKFCGFWGLKNGYKVDDEGNFTYWAFTDEGREMTKFINRFYLDGTLDPDAFANNFEQWKTKFSNERIVGAIGDWWISYNAGHEVWQSLDPNMPEDKRFVQIGFKAEEAKEANLSGKNYLGSRCTIITDKAKNPEAIMKFLNFQATDLGKAISGWGLPNGTAIGDTGRTGKFWNIDENGNWEVDPQAKQQLITETWSYDDEYYWQGVPWLFMNQSRWDDGEHNIWPNQMWYEENKWKSMMINNLSGTIYDSSMYTLRVKPDEVKLAEQSVSDAWKMNWGAVVQANSDEEFDAAWTRLQDALKVAGINQLEQALSDNYKANMKKMEQ